MTNKSENGSQLPSIMDIYFQRATEIAKVKGKDHEFAPSAQELLAWLNGQSVSGAKKEESPEDTELKQ